MCAYCVCVSGCMRWENGAASKLLRVRTICFTKIRDIGTCGRDKANVSGMQILSHKIIHGIEHVRKLWWWETIARNMLLRFDTKYHIFIAFNQYLYFLSVLLVVAYDATSPKYQYKCDDKKNLIPFKQRRAMRPHTMSHAHQIRKILWRICFFF